MLLLLVILMVVESAAKSMFPLKYRDIVFKYSTENGVDPYLVFSIIKAESSFNARATSGKKAKGLMQITDQTGHWAAEVLKIEDFKVEQLYDPETNILIGCWYLRRLKQEFGNDDLVIAAYNGGSGNVSEWLDNREYSDTGRSLRKIPFRETEKYLKRVKNYYSIYKKLYGKTDECYAK